MDSNAIKNTGIGIGVLLVCYAGYSWLQKKKAEDTIGTDENQAANLKKIQVNPKNITKEEFYYKNIADQLYTELSKRVPLLDIFTYDSQKVFGYLQGLNPDELKEVLKAFGVRSLKIFNLVSLPDGGTLLEWFDNILSKTDLDKMHGIWEKTGLWQVSQHAISRANYNTYLDNWFTNSLSKVKYPNPRVNKGNKVYSLYIGNEKWTFLDCGWWDINSYKAKAPKGLGDFYIRPGNAIQPLGAISDVYRVSEGPDKGKILVIKVRLTHSKLYYTGNIPLAGREVWLIPSRLTDTPYNPPSMNGLEKSKNQPLINLL